MNQGSVLLTSTGDIDLLKLSPGSTLHIVTTVGLSWYLTATDRLRVRGDKVVGMSIHSNSPIFRGVSAPSETEATRFIAKDKPIYFKAGGHTVGHSSGVTHAWLDVRGVLQKLI